MNYNKRSVSDRPAESSCFHFRVGEPFNPKKFLCYGAFIPDAVLGAKNLSSSAKCLYGHCWRRSGSGCFPSLRDCGTALKLSTRQVKRCVDALVRKGFLRANPRFRYDGSQTSNEYEFLWHETMREQDFRPRRGDDISVMGEGVRNDSASPDKNVIPGMTKRSALEEKSSNHHHQENKIQVKVSGTRTAVSIRDASPPQKPLGKADDESILDPAEYATSEDELKAIVRAKTGQDIPRKELIWIKERLELQGVTVEDFVAVVREHARNDWKNPIGFLKDFARNFRRNTRPAAPPLQKSAAGNQQPKCPCSWGYIGQDPHIFCPNCSLGRDLARQADRKPRLSKKPMIETESSSSALGGVMHR